MNKITLLLLLVTIVSLQTSFAQKPKTLDAIIASIEFKEDT